ncbi:unnamed protein product [Mesocestoides corti]|uniref:Uncharacterized protein n=1 Tax=Mesocestoides corti TaxID=53468 RepID=A0A0R3UQB1_MESCO|nr:unnamed protein product [Mesocestoides corti]
MSLLFECGDVGESPASLILVIGSSLSVLRNYAFLWPVGLGRCVGANPRTSRKRTRRVAKSASRDVDSHTDGDGARCQLAVINLLPTCKDGLATFLSRRPCDEVLRETVELGLGLSLRILDKNLYDQNFRVGDAVLL